MLSCFAAATSARKRLLVVLKSWRQNKVTNWWLRGIKILSYSDVDDFKMKSMSLKTYSGGEVRIFYASRQFCMRHCVE